jgi:hypothetical protein
MPPSNATIATSTNGSHRRAPGRTSIGRRLRTGISTEPTSTSAATPPTPIRVRYCPSGAKSSSTVPPLPAGMSHACCQPSVRTRCSG